MGKRKQGVNISIETNISKLSTKLNRLQQLLEEVENTITEIETFELEVVIDQPEGNDLNENYDPLTGKFTY